MDGRPTDSNFWTQRIGRRKLLGGTLAAAAIAAAPNTAVAAPAAAEPENRAKWDFRLGHADDLSGHGHTGTAGSGVSFGVDGARFAGSNTAEIAVPYSTEYQPEAAGLLDLGGSWELRLTGVRPASIRADYQAIVSSRAGNDGWIVYLLPNGSIEFWMKQSDGSSGYAKAVSGVRAVAGQTYDITASWTGVRMSIHVSGSASGSGAATPLGRYTPMGSTAPLRFGNGGSAGAEFFFDGTIAMAAITVLVPAVDPDDAEFFGLWDSETAQWTVPSSLDFAAAPGLAPVESAVRARDFTVARRLLRDHIAARLPRETLPASYNGTFRPGLLPLFLDHVWTLGTGEILQDTITVGAADSVSRAEVSDAVQRALDSGAATVGIFLMARHKEPATAVFHSRSAPSGGPVLELIAADGSTTEVMASADTYIRAGTDADRVFGAETDLLVHDEGTGAYAPATSKAYLTFPLPSAAAAAPPVSARLRLTGRTTGGAAEQQVLVFQTLEDFDEATRTWANTVQNTFSWQGDPGGFDWRGPAGSDREFGFQLPRFYMAGPLADAYLDSDEETTADGLIGLMSDFIADADRYGTPYGAGSFPRSLDTAIRVSNWIYALERVRRSSALDPDRLTAILRTLERSGRYLTTAVNPTPNWMQTQKRALAAIAIHFPEFASSKTWRENATDFLSGQFAEVLYADGGYAEASDDYAYGVAGTAASLHAYFEANGYRLSGKDDLHRLVNFLADQTLPGGWGPGYGDGGSEDRRAPLRQFADLFDDAALRHIATDGAEGTPPDHTSVLYPDTRVAVLRSGWRPDAAYLRINADRGAHSHPDNLAVTVVAHGRQLLPELGAFTYSDDPRSNWLRRTTTAQTTVEVDGGAQSLTADGGFDTFTTNAVFDLVTGWTQGSATVRHTRTVLFVRPGAIDSSALWVVSDQLRPEDAVAHTYRQHWHFLPDAKPKVDAAGATFTGFDSGANLLIAPAAEPGLSVEIGDGFYSPRFYSVTTNRHARVSRSGSGPVVFDTLLQPTPDATRPATAVSRLAVSGAAEGEVGAMAIDYGRGRSAVVLVSHVGAGRMLGLTSSIGSYTVDGTLAYVERDAMRTTWLLHGGQFLVYDGATVVDAPRPFTDLAIRFDRQRGDLRIDGSQLFASTDPADAIRIALPDARSVTLNGTAVAFVRRSGAILAAAVA